MMKMTIFQIWLLSLLGSLAFVTSQHADIDNSNGLRRNQFVVETQGMDRELVGWSWTNLLFRMGVCQTPSTTCPDYSSNGCGCPDCTKKLIPPHLHAYCKSLNSGSDSSSSGSSSGSASGSSSYSRYGGGTNADYYENTEDKESDTQTPSRIFKPWILFLVGSGLAAMAAGGFVRRREMMSAKNAENMNAEAGTPYSKMDGLATAAIAGSSCLAAALISMGIRKGSPESDAAASTSPASDASVVAQRMNLMRAGSAESGTSGKSVLTGPHPPTFLKVPAPMSGVYTDVQISGDVGIEVEGPFQPSSYAI